MFPLLEFYYSTTGFVEKIIKSKFKAIAYSKIVLADKKTINDYQAHFI
jgi:hypothetical protein